MRFNLHLTHWSLLFITLISSCFLFYVVASENAKYATTRYTATDATMASIAAVTTPPPPPPAASTLTQASDSDSASTNTAEQEKIVKPKENREDETVNILPNYKKVKKLQTPPVHSQLKINQPESLSAEGDLNEGEVQNAPAHASIAESDDDLLMNSDSNVVVNEIDSVVGSNLVSSENVDVVDNSNSVGDSKNSDNERIHSSLMENVSAEESHNEGGGDGEQTTNEQQQRKMSDVVDTAENTNDGGVSTDDNADKEKSLPDITDIPTVTVTELPLEILQPSQNSMDSVIIAGDVVGESETPDERVVNRTVDVVVDNEGDIQKDGQIVKINDSGGGSGDGSAPTMPVTNLEHLEIPTATNIPNDASTNDTQQYPSSHNDSGVEQKNDSTLSSASSSASLPSAASTENAASQVNLTAEEVPMPVFSEWAQKQMEAAEKQALEQEQTFNNSAQRKNNTNGNGKPPALKIRAKNYASPDCGAKIIASSAYTSNAGAVLSSSKDEYMLSLCGNRIWFVVELCEAIQAQKIDFANFELYSSSPQNFTVAVSKRFPTREWSNVGRFMAEDKRAVQSFDLHPHLFGKFVRVDINSHYSKEHFCTLSLFRVFGTSEFEAFETENHPNEDMDDFDDEDMQEQSKGSEQNLFKSASDAVLSIVKKATELVGKPSQNQNQTFKTPQHAVVCRTPIYGLFSCAECPSTLVERVNNALSCEFSQLNSLLNVADIRNDLLNTRVCTQLYGIETNHLKHLTSQKDIRQSFYVNILPKAYVGALCQLLAMPKVQPKISDRIVINETDNKEGEETSTNQTLDKKFGKEDLELLDKPETKLIKPEIPIIRNDNSEEIISADPIRTSTETPIDDQQQQLPRPLETGEDVEVTTATPKIIEQPSIPDKNIFNVPAEELPPSPTSSETELPERPPVETPKTSTENLEQTVTSPPTPTATVPPTPSKIETMPTISPEPQATTPTPPRSEEDNSWDNIESLLTSTPPSTAPSVGSSGFAQHNGGGSNLNQKLSNGPQSESVFIRLSNRIKALERNMSLSGQYLEELSRRYKKQVEELQQTLTQQIQTVRTLEEQSRRHHELEQLYAQRNTQLKHELDDLTLQVHACIVVIIFVGAFVFLVLMVGILFYRSLRRDTKEVLALYGQGGKRKAEVSNVSNIQKKLNRRKSFEDYSDHQQSMQRRDPDAKGISGSEKLRRPSEEAMLILKDCKGDTKMVVGQVKSNASLEADSTANCAAAAGRQRKISVCYGSNNNINATTGLPPPPLQTQKSAGGGRRKGEKHSWPNAVHAQLQAMHHLEQLNNDDLVGDCPEALSTKSKKPTFLNGSANIKSKKKKDYLRRQESSPPEKTNALNNTAPADVNNAADFDEKLMLDEDDLDNFIPNADLAYNEFMPDGPRGYQCLATAQTNANNPASKKTQLSKSDGNGKKSRRLSSPVFFKSPFTKSLKGKITSSKSNPPHESTSWEWYRLRKSSSANGPNSNAAANSTTTTNAFLRVSPNASLDSSSLSEINFPTNSTENSFRILEEAILSSGESVITTTTTGSSSTNGNNRTASNKSVGGGGGSGAGSGGNGSGMAMMNSCISSSSNSNRSSSSNSSTTQSKKKNRSFNKIFRKVF